LRKTQQSAVFLIIPPSIRFILETKNETILQQESISKQISTHASIQILRILDNGGARQLQRISHERMGGTFATMAGYGRNFDKAEANGYPLFSAFLAATRFSFRLAAMTLTDADN
jgi:hypothetical protein